MSEHETIEGGCYCRAVRFKSEGEPLWVSHCHCGDCRRSSGAAVSTFMGVPTAGFAFTAGEAKPFESSPGVTRRFCGACGTPLTYETMRLPDEVHILIGALDHPEAFAAQGHVFTDFQLPWLKMDDELTRYGRIPDRPERRKP